VNDKLQIYGHGDGDPGEPQNMGYIEVKDMKIYYDPDVSIQFINQDP
jgi:hypothetical protein